jgi:DNA-directed RNA polymerase subunit RPC12/RpoP
MDRDKDKVIKGLTSCSGSDPCVNSCPYYDNSGNNYSCTGKLAKDALALLKENESKAKWVYCEDEYGQDGYKCSECGFFVSKNALALLKAQEVDEPKQVDLYGKDEWWGFVCVCPYCKAEWMSATDDTHFCPNCGRKVKWDDNRT